MERAEGEYEVVERLAPHGFFTYQPELDCIRRERKGEFPPGTCRTYVPIADAPESAENRAALEKLLERSPCLAPAWQKLSNMLDDDDARLSAIEKGLACHPDPQTRGYLLVNKALIIHRRGKDDEAISMPGDVALDPQSPPDNQPIAKQTLAFILAEPKAR